jgi:hypothetical protein
MSDAALGTTGDRVTISTEQVELLSVAGRLNGEGLRRLQRRLDELLDAGARLLVADLSGVSAAMAGWSICWPEPTSSCAAAGAGCAWSGWGRR